MRRLRATSVAMLVCLALGAVPAPAQEASEEPSAVSVMPDGPALVTGTQTCAGGEPDTRTQEGPVLTGHIAMVDCTDEMSDPRVSGPDRGEWNYVCHSDAENGCVYWGTTEIVGPDGTWVGTYTGTDDADLWDAGQAGAVMIQVLEGTGAYEGWTFVAHVVTDLQNPATINGLIYEGPPPPWGPIPAADSEPSVLPTPASSLATIGLPADDGARIVEIETIDARARDLTVESPSVGTVQVRLLLPSAFDEQPETRWPVLYLLQGCCDTYDSWTRETDVEELTAPADLLVVMPAATAGADGGFGWYTDWYNGGHGGQPAWETFHLTELRQLLERNWQAGDDRVIAGLSMGGYGAMAYAARHPDMFQAAASYSGLVDLLGLFFDPSPAAFGSRVADADVWQAHDPLALAPALADIPLYVAYGNGQPGPLDPEGTMPDDIEAAIAGLNDAFVARLEDLGIPATINAYGAGTHTWPYWERELHASLPLLLEALET